MKKSIFTLALCVCSTLCYSADWTPVFKSWETKAEDSVTMEKIRSYTISDDTISMSKVLNSQAKQGNYKGIPLPYRADMLPAKFKKLSEFEYEVTIPLKNATLYGMPISSLNMYGCLECGFFGSYVNFKPMTNAQYQKLKKINFIFVEGEVCGDSQAKFRRENGVVYLSMDRSC